QKSNRFGYFPWFDQPAQRTNLDRRDGISFAFFNILEHPGNAHKARTDCVDPDTAAPPLTGHAFGEHVDRRLGRVIRMAMVGALPHHGRYIDNGTFTTQGHPLTE